MESNKGKLVPLLILPVIWGSYYVASQKLVGYTSAFTSGLGIRLLTMIFLTVIMWRRKEIGLLLKTKGVRGRLFLIGTLGFLLDLTAFIGLSMSSAASGTALLKCDVLMVNILSMIIYRQRFTWKAWACTFVMLFGVFLVMGFDFATFQIGDPGNIFFLLSAFFVSLNAFVIKNVQLDKYNPICDDVVAYYNNFVTMIYFTAASLVMGTLMLAAHAVGVASCWIHRAREVFDSEEGKALLKSWGIEGDYAGVGHCVLGYAAEQGEAPAKARKENYVIRV